MAQAATNGDGEEVNNGHTNEQLDKFAEEQLAIIKEQRDALIKRIKEFHRENCSAPVEVREGCADAFVVNFLMLMACIQEEQDAR